MCANLSDVCALSHLHTLNLNGCDNNLSDVSALGHVGFEWVSYCVRS
jgi:hypothetical protein